MNRTARRSRRSRRAAALRAQLADHDAQLEAQAVRTGRPVTFWSTIPGIPRATIDARRAELRDLDQRPHGLAQSERTWTTLEDAIFGARMAA